MLSLNCVFVFRVQFVRPFGHVHHLSEQGMSCEVQHVFGGPLFGPAQYFCQGCSGQPAVLWWWRVPPTMWDAAWDAGWYAAWDAGWYAAWDAGWYAAWDAGWYAAWDAATTLPAQSVWSLGDSVKRVWGAGCKELISTILLEPCLSKRVALPVVSVSRAWDACWGYLF